jgi:hypothetical protein
MPMHEDSYHVIREYLRHHFQKDFGGHVELIRYEPDQEGNLVFTLPLYGDADRRSVLRVLKRYLENTSAEEIRMTLGRCCVADKLREKNATVILGGEGT